MSITEYPKKEADLHLLKHFYFGHPVNTISCFRLESLIMRREKTASVRLESDTRDRT